MDYEFEAEIWYWRGPTPYFFASMPKESYPEIKGVSNFITYGWGMIPVKVTIGGTEFKTQLFPKDGNYAIPIKAAVRKTENIGLGDRIQIKVEVLQSF